MRTDDLIGMLSRGAGRADPPGDGRALLVWLPGALAIAVVVVALGLGLVPMSLWPESRTFLKIGYAVALGSAGVWLLRRLGRPGASVAVPMALVALIVAVAAATGLYDVLRLPAEAQGMQVMGKSATRCPLAIAVLSIPALLACLHAGRTLAPLNPRLAGTAAGLAAGGLAAAAYGLACDEGALAFIAIWYTLGMTIAAGIGALAGPLALRW